MKKILALVLCAVMCMALLAGCSGTPNKIEEIAADYITKISEGKVSAAMDYLSEDYKSRTSEEKQKDFFDSLTKECGAFLKISSSETKDEEDGTKLVSTMCSFEKATATYNIYFDSDNKITKVETLYTLFSDSPETPYNVAQADMKVGDGTDWALDGTFTYPNDKKGPYDVVLFVHGSGPSNRNEAIGNQALFRDLAHALAADGIASLRYDKRTYTYAQKVIDTYGDNITVQEETIDDVLAAINTLKTQSDFKVGNIYIAGHSMGGMLLGAISEQTDDVAGYIFLAANARGLDELVVEQYEYLLNLDSEMSEQDNTLLQTVKEGAQNIASLTEDSTLAADELLGIAKPYWMWFKSYDAVGAAAKIDKPMLFLQGEKDYQVTMTDFNIYRDKIGSRSNATFISYPNLNHMFTASEGEKATPNDYEAMVTADPKVARDIVSFISGN